MQTQYHRLSNPVVMDESNERERKCEQRDYRQVLVGLGHKLVVNGKAISCTRCGAEWKSEE